MDGVAPAVGESASAPAGLAVLPQRQVLPSGTALTVRAGDGGEEIHLRSPNGSMELRIRMTDDGPVLTLHGVSLAIEASERVTVNCREFAVNATDGVQVNTAGNFEVQSGAEVRVKSAGQTYLDGELVNLNCLGRAGYPDAGAQDAPAQAGEEGAPRGAIAGGAPGTPPQ